MKIGKSDDLEIGRILHLKLEIRNFKLDKARQGQRNLPQIVQFEISDF